MRAVPLLAPIGARRPAGRAAQAAFRKMVILPAATKKTVILKEWGAFSSSRAWRWWFSG
jgi:hypothetical protein